MFQEPEYVFVKGQGWVITPPPPDVDFRIVTLRTGQLVKLEYRKPVFGQDMYYDAASRNSKWFDANGNIQWQNWTDSYSSMRLSMIPTIQSERDLRFDDCYVTITVIEP